MPEFAEFIYPMTLFCMLVGAGFGLPVPEELPVVLGGIWVAQESTIESFGLFRWLMLPACIVGVVLSDGALYMIGRKFGARLLETRWLRRIVPPAKQEEIRANFHNHGIKVLLFARLLPGIRMPMFIMAGVMKLPLKRFIIADGIYAIPGVSLLFFLGWWLGNSFKEFIEKFHYGVEHYFLPLLFLVLIAGIGGYLLYKFFRKPISTGDPADVPIIGPIAIHLEHKHETHKLMRPQAETVKLQGPLPDGAPQPAASSVEDAGSPPGAREEI